jgi:hypothetical protein
MVCLYPKIPTFVFFSLTSSKLYIIYNNLLSPSTRAEYFIHCITNKGQLIYNNNSKLYKFLSELKYLHFKQVLVVFKISKLMDLYIKELKNDI